VAVQTSMSISVSPLRLSRQTPSRGILAYKYMYSLLCSRNQPTVSPRSSFAITSTMAFPNPDVVYTDYNGSLYDIVANQIQEMELVRSKIFQLEQTHMQMKQKYV
jgi:hypothetical protein